MLYHFCKSCQYCLEGLYWSCCEEKFCFDEKIATYKLEDDIKTIYSNGYTNMGGSFDSIVTEQPVNNNHLPHRNGTRDVNELPLHADKLYEIFSKSLIFKDEQELKSKSSTDTLDRYETKSDPGYDRPNRTKVYFEDEVNSPVTDFEIMFKDELMGSYEMFKIDEEEDSIKSEDTEDGLVMNVCVKKQDVIKPSTVTPKDEIKITTIHPIYKYDPGVSVHVPSLVSLPRSESLKGILRQTNDMSRSLSAKNLERVDSANRLYKHVMKRVESSKTMDATVLNKVLARVPQRSASFLNVPDHLVPEKPPLVKSKSMVGVGTIAEENEVRLGSLPDTPIIKSNNLPRYFADSPTIPEYRRETSLQSIQQRTTLKMMEQGDFSMPRYYGLTQIDPTPVHESKSMPDLTNPMSTGKVNKRLVKLRSRLKPLVIKKSSDERL